MFELTSQCSCESKNIIGVIDYNCVGRIVIDLTVMFHRYICEKNCSLKFSKLLIAGLETKPLKMYCYLYRYV